MNYIKRLDKKIVVDDKLFNISPIAYINSLSLRYLREYNQILKCTRKLFNINRYTPLYISESILLIQTTQVRQYDYFAFNYFEIDHMDIYDYETTLHFKDQKTTSIKISKHRIKKLINQARIVLDYMASFK